MGRNATSDELLDGAGKLPTNLASAVLDVDFVPAASALAHEARGPI
jgi:hypothetical protein